MWVWVQVEQQCTGLQYVSMLHSIVAYVVRHRWVSAPYGGSLIPMHMLLTDLVAWYQCIHCPSVVQLHPKVISLPQYPAGLKAQQATSVCTPVHTV
jgi:hypothetical protein